MKISKKVLSVILSLIMVFSVVAASSVTASAADVTFPEYDSTKTSLVIGTSQAKSEGAKVLVPVSIENNPGLWAVNIQFAYDTESLSIESAGAVTKGSVLTGFCDYSVADGIITVYIEQEGNDFVSTTANGVLFNIEFTVNKYTVGAHYPVEFTHKDRYSIIEAQSGASLDGITFKHGGVECVQDKITPAQVTGLKATFSSSYKVAVSWSAAKNASKYEVYRKMSSTDSYKKIKTTASKSFTDTLSSSANGKTVYYKVRAISSTGTYGAYSSAKTVKVVITPAQVTGLKVTRTAMYKAKVSWSAAKNASKYEVYRRIGSSGSYKKIKTTTSKSYTDTFTKTANGKTVYYKVRAISKTATAGTYSSAKTTKVMGTVKGAVSKITVPAKKALTVYAKANTNASGYQYQIALNKKFTSGKKEGYTSAKSKKFTKLSAKKTYYVRIRPYQTIAGKKVYGSWSTVKTKKTK